MAKGAEHILGPAFETRWTIGRCAIVEQEVANIDGHAFARREVITAQIGATGESGAAGERIAVGQPLIAVRRIVGCL